MAEAAKHKKKLEQLETGEVEEQDRDRRREEEEDSGRNGNPQQDSEGIDWGMGRCTFLQYIIRNPHCLSFCTSCHLCPR